LKFFSVIPFFGVHFYSFPNCEKEKNGRSDADFIMGEPFSTGEKYGNMYRLTAVERWRWIYTIAVVAEEYFIIIQRG